MHNRQKEIVALLERAIPDVDKDWKEVGPVLAAQAGLYCRASYHAKAYKDDKGYRAEAESQIQDIILQCQIACERLGCDFEVLMEQGWLNFENRMGDVILHKLQAKLKCQDCEGNNKLSPVIDRLVTKDEHDKSLT